LDDKTELKIAVKEQKQKESKIIWRRRRETKEMRDHDEEEEGEIGGEER